jgi:hypothetical protein
MKNKFWNCAQGKAGERHREKPHGRRHIWGRKLIIGNFGNS